MKSWIVPWMAAMYIVLGKLNGMEDYCQLNEFTDMDYYILCETEKNVGVSDIEQYYAIYGGDAVTLQQGQEFYQKYKDIFYASVDGNEDMDTGKKPELIYISPDCKWVISRKLNNGAEFPTGAMGSWTLYYEGKIREQEEKEFLYVSPLPFIIVEAEDGYKELEYYEQYEHLYDNLTYLGNFYVNEYGTQAVAEKRFQQLDILDLETEEVLWEYPLEEKEGIYEILQFTGSQDNGKIIVHTHNNMVYEISVPDGSRKLIGEDMYDVSISPDGKYIVYSSAANYDDIMLSEIGQYPSQRTPGIYVEELATGRTAYIDIELSGFDLFDRNFLWIPKDAFDTFLKEGN